MRLIATAAFVVSAVFAQGPEQRVFTFAHIEDERQIQEFVNSLRSVGEIREVAVDAAARTFRVAGTPDQISLAEWLLDSLDLASRPQSFQFRSTMLSDPREGVVKVCYPVHIGSPQAMQETVNAVRSIAEVQRVSAFYAAPAIIVRSTPEGAAFAEWLIREADAAAAGNADRSTREYRFDDTRLPVERRTRAGRIYFPANMRTLLQIQEAVNVLRSILEVQRVVAFTSGWGIAIRGSEQQAAAGDWLVRQLDAERSADASIDFDGQIVRAFFVPGRHTPREIADKVNLVRSSTGMQRVVMYQGRNAIVVRGTSAQVADAAALLR